MTPKQSARYRERTQNARKESGQSRLAATTKHEAARVN